MCLSKFLLKKIFLHPFIIDIYDYIYEVQSILNYF